MTRFIRKRDDTLLSKVKSKTKKKDSLQSTVNCKLKSKNATKKDALNKPSNLRKCRYYKCKKKAIGEYTFNIDIPGLPYCEKHKNDIGSAILWTILGIEELAQHSMGVPPKKDKK